MMEGKREGLEEHYNFLNKERKENSNKRRTAAMKRNKVVIKVINCNCL